MKYLATLTIAALLALGGAARANVTDEHCVRFMDSQSYTFDGGANTAETLGSICLRPDNSIRVLSFYNAGPKFSTVEWITLGTNAVPVYSESSCNWVTPTWVAIEPYLDGYDMHLCGEATCTVNYAGTYRVLGDGARDNIQGGGVRAGVILRDANGHSYVLVIKTGNTTVNGGACVTGGPGSVGQWLLIDQWPHFRLAP